MARLLQQLASYLGALEVLAFLVVFIASFSSDDFEAGAVGVVAIIYLPIAIIVPADTNPVLAADKIRAIQSVLADAD
ncbi:MAG: hypothetical protein H0V95_00525 [Actinobacteria bacterium]|nr:hypothetical protein [Actinomycetota bacterium]